VGAPVSRDDGWARADVDTGYFEDAKLRDLWRLVRDEAQMARAVCLHQATLLASWRQGCRVTVEQAVPLWLTPDAELMKALRKVQLLDRRGRIPVASWAQWYEVAEQRRVRRQQAGRMGGLASGLSRTTDAQRLPKQPLTDAEPNQTNQTNQPDHDARADLEAFLEVRFRVPTPAQRTFMDGYCRTFDATGPERAARLILSHPDDPIGALKDDLAAFRNRRKEEAAAQEEPKPKPRRSGLNGESLRIAQLFREQDEAREQERLERLVAEQAAAS